MLKGKKLRARTTLKSKSLFEKQSYSSSSCTSARVVLSASPRQEIFLSTFLDRVLLASHGEVLAWLIWPHRGRF